MLGTANEDSMTGSRLTELGGVCGARRAIVHPRICNASAAVRMSHRLASAYRISFDVAYRSDIHGGSCGVKI